MSKGVNPGVDGGDVSPQIFDWGGDNMSNILPNFSLDELCFLNTVFLHLFFNF